MISKKEKLEFYRHLQRIIPRMKPGDKKVFGNRVTVICEADNHPVSLTSDRLGKLFSVDDYYMTRVPEIFAVVFREAMRSLG